MKNLTIKKVMAFVVIAAFLSSCSQYTCATYAKKEVKSNPTERTF